MLVIWEWITQLPESREVVEFGKELIMKAFCLELKKFMFLVASA